MIAKFGNYLIEWLSNYNLNENIVLLFKHAIVISSIAVLCIIVNYIAKEIIIKVIERIASKTETTWDDAFVERKVFVRLSHFFPAIIIYYLAPSALQGYPIWIGIVHAGAKIYMISTSLVVINAFLDAVHDIYNQYEVAKYKPIKGYLQVVKIIVYFIIGILILSVIINKSPLYLLGGLGAITAVLMLVFKDTILGFVGSIQLSANDMVRPGDWITMPKYGADGSVIDINLNTVKVQNSDKTITTIPTYSLIIESFQNWRGMEESGVRRIKRAVNIDVTSIKFCTEEMLDKFEKIHLIVDYIKNARKEIIEYNSSNNIDQSRLANGKRLTNIGVFRAYLEVYLRNNADLNKEMTLLVRHLQQTEVGLPIEIIVFSKIQEWVKYEAIQSDMFDHILAVVSDFELRIFQNPTGNDLKQSHSNKN